MGIESIVWMRTTIEAFPSRAYDLRDPIDRRSWIECLELLELCLRQSAVRDEQALRKFHAVSWIS
jgi:hypothetical protein